MSDRQGNLSDIRERGAGVEGTRAERWEVGGEVQVHLQATYACGETFGLLGVVFRLPLKTNTCILESPSRSAPAFFVLFSLLPRCC